MLIQTQNVPQQAQNLCIAFDVGPTLYKCYTKILCLLGSVMVNINVLGVSWKLRPQSIMF